MVKRVAIFGASGFVGGYVVALLARQGIRLRLISRNPQDAHHLTTQGEVGQIIPLYGDVANSGEVSQAIEGCDGVINLAGVLNPPFTRTFYQVHKFGAINIAANCTRLGIKRLVHVSALGVENLTKASHYANSKQAGEQAVRELHREAVILKPSILFGSQDEFLARLALVVKYSPIVPVVGSGIHRLKHFPYLRWEAEGWKCQPLYVEDFAAAIVKALTASSRETNITGATIKLGGAKIYSFKELLTVLKGNNKRLMVPLPVGAVRAMAAAIGWIPYAPLSLAQANMLTHHNTTTENGFRTLKLKPKGELAKLAPSLFVG